MHDFRNQSIMWLDSGSHASKIADTTIFRLGRHCIETAKSRVRYDALELRRGSREIIRESLRLLEYKPGTLKGDPERGRKLTKADRGTLVSNVTIPSPVVPA